LELSMNPSEVDDLTGLHEEPVVLPPPALSPAALAGPASWNLRLLRLVYAVEFLIALIAIISLWSEVGGEGHLDLMPWYIKLACIGGLAWSSVRFTAGLVEQQKVWTRRTIAWLAAIVLFCVAMGGITYYYHLHEQPDDDDDDDSATAMNIYRGDFIHGGRSNQQIPIRFLARPELSAGHRMPAGSDGGDSRLRL
jgi:uncharacterized membrane protein